MSESAVPLPGLNAPAAGFDAPFDMLAGCHERVQRSLDLLARLIDHVERHGVDAQARDAAADVRRYFDRAAPHHHDDEERHVIPRLLASGQPALVQAAQTMRDDHVRMHQAWVRLGPLLHSLQDAADGAWPVASLATLRTQAHDFAALYARHIPLEDDLAFPAARQAMDSAALAAMGADMALRRGVTRPAA